jgi:uncharacterized protein
VRSAAARGLCPGGRGLNVGDVSRRGLFGAAAAAILAAALLVILLAGSGRSFEYGDPFEPFPSGAGRGTAEEVSGAPEPDTELIRFLEFVAGDVQQFWEQRFARGGQQYDRAQVVVFRDAVRSGCGIASAATGPFYCTLDRSVYLDLGFFRQLAVTFRAPGDFAQAYVIAHELGHHVQNLMGITAQVEDAKAEGLAPTNELSIALELQADCLAGVWGFSTYERGLLEGGDLDEGLRAASAVGDDRIQAEATGRINPETWTHGSSEQRRTWFLRGFSSGDPNDCDTFSSGV